MSLPPLPPEHGGRHPVLTIGLEFISGERWIGGSMYLRNLVYCLATLPEVERPKIKIMGNSSVDDPTVGDLVEFSFVDLPGGNKRIVNSRLLSLWARGRRRLMSKLGVREAMHSDIDAVYPGFGPKLSGAARIHWIPDLQHRQLPEMFDAKEIEARDVSMAAVARSKGILVLSSESTRHDFEASFPDATVTTRVWRFCTILTGNERGGANPHTSYSLPRRYLYLPNQFWQHKNHITAFRALARLRESGIRIPLVCTGLENDPRHPEHIDYLRRYLSECGLHEDVHMLGQVPRSDQIEIFRHAVAVVQPSRSEGWSTVVEDTKVIGRPLFLSDLPVHHEQLSDDPLGVTEFFDPQDDHALAELLGRAWGALEAGPDLSAEAAAQARGAQSHMDAARKFIAIVAEAVRLERGHQI